jgi:Ca2+-binding RTX toxin-like protein
LFGGDGADQFRFFGGSSNDRTASREIEGSSDTDFIRDLDFVEGDSIVLNGFGVGKFVEAAGANALDNGNSVIITSYAGLRAIDDASDAISITRLSNGNLIVSIMDSEGAFQNISITGGVAGYDASAPTSLIRTLCKREGQETSVSCPFLFQSEGGGQLASVHKGAERF